QHETAVVTALPTTSSATFPATCSAITFPTSSFTISPTVSPAIFPAKSPVALAIKFDFGLCFACGLRLEFSEEYALNLDKFIDRFKKNSKYPIENYNLAKMATAYKEYIYFERQGYGGNYSAQWGFQIIYHPWRYTIKSLQDPEKYLKIQ
ncbi:15787_t:CDS:2, partial [Funneliformis mosseae]